MVKKLKQLKDIKRDALLDRYYLKCRRAQCERFFFWRSKFLKLKMVHRAVVQKTIDDEYEKNKEWTSTTVYALKDVRVPPTLGLEHDQVANFNKVINHVYPLA